jgi:hypothetical protein
MNTMHKNRLAEVVALAAVALAAACTGVREGPSWQGTISDSAGVAMVANPEAGVWGPDDAWGFVEEYRVGGMDVAEEAEFGLVVGLAVDPAGNIYVADQQVRRIQVFGPDGTFLRTIGEPGSGPGEISQGLFGVWVMGEELWAADVNNLRVNRYSLEGESLGAEPLDFTRGAPVRWDQVGASVVAQMRGIPGAGMGDTSGGDPVVTVGQDPQDTVMVLGVGETIEMSEGGQARMTLFSQEPLWDAAADGRLLSALNSEYRIELRNADGALTRVMTRPYTPRPVTESDQLAVRTLLRDLMLEQGAPPPAVDQFMQGVGFAPNWPVMAQILAGPNGTVWAQRIRTSDDVSAGGEEFNPQDLGSDEWDIFDAEGRYLGVLTMPAKFAPLRIDGDALWGVQRDEFDVNSVVRYRLVMN